MENPSRDELQNDSKTPPFKLMRTTNYDPLGGTFGAISSETQQAIRKRMHTNSGKLLHANSQTPPFKLMSADNDPTEADFGDIPAETQ